MSRDFFRNRCKLGSIPQFPSVPGALQKLIDFNSSAELTDNFTQFLGSGATQTIASGILQFRNSSYDKDNHIESKFTLKFLDKFEAYENLNAWSSASSYHAPSFNFKIVDASGAVVTGISIQLCFSWTYSPDGWPYYNSGYISYRLDTDANNSTVATSRRLTACPSRNAYHKYELINNNDGTYTFKLDGVAAGTINLGNSAYRLGNWFGHWPLSGWYNNSMSGDLDYIYFTYRN